MNETTEELLLTLSLSSPNLPYGDWSFIINEIDNSIKVFNDTSRGGFSQTFVKVCPTDYPKIEARKVYMNALLNPEAIMILYNEHESLYKNAKFGVYNKSGYLVVSNIEEEVNRGILGDLGEGEKSQKY